MPEGISGTFEYVYEEAFEHYRHLSFRPMIVISTEGRNLKYNDIIKITRRCCSSE